MSSLILDRVTTCWCPTSVDMEILCFFAGITFVFLNKGYALFFLVAVLLFRLRAVYVLWFSAAIIWGWVHQFEVADSHMPNVDMLQSVDMEGYVASIPNPGAKSVRFGFKALNLMGQPVSATLALSCYKNCPPIHANQAWHLTLKLKKTRNLSNPGGFDYIQFLAAKHVHWTGIVSAFKRCEPSFCSIPADGPYWLLKWREALAQRLARFSKNPDTDGIVQALTLGVTSSMHSEQWDLFRKTGTTHLMVISGAHIGLIAGLVYALIRTILRFFPFIFLRIPVQKIASLSSLLAALAYALLAGFAVPAERAFIVCFFILFQFFSTYKFSVWQAWRYALLIVLIGEPHSVLLPGFYLSFLAVGILIVTSSWIQNRQSTEDEVRERAKASKRKAFGLRKLSAALKTSLLLQLACLLGLMPLTLFWFSYGAINGMLANLVAIPWVSFIVVPLALLSILFGQWTMGLTAYSIQVLIAYLQWVNGFSGINLTFSLAHPLSVIALMLALPVFLMSHSGAVRSLLIIGSLAAFWPKVEHLKPGEFGIDILDVGQGLSVVVKTAHHVLLYDTGMKFYQGSDMGERVILPYLKTQGIKKADKVVISHPDLDHRGGLVSLEKAGVVGSLIVDEPAFYHRGSSCHQYPSWVWDGILFQFFSVDGDRQDKNNRSCVLKVSDKKNSVLLTGDIEKTAEQALAQRYGRKLASTVLVVPHHGSQTSSSEVFLKQVLPRYAIISLGFDNRYHFPHQSVIRRYKRANIPVYNTRECGMIRVRFQGDKHVKPIGWKVC